MNKSSKLVDEYIISFPDNIQEFLVQLRKTIKEFAPHAEESIAYGMPSYKTNGMPLVYFAGFKNHIGFYATPGAHNEFSSELSIYKHGKGSVQFPINTPLPIELIKRIIEFRVAENNAKLDSKLKNKKNVKNKSGF